LIIANGPTVAMRPARDFEEYDMLTPDQIELIRASWRKLLPDKERVAKMFYARLFEMDPSLKLLFKGDLDAQGRKLMAMISTAVDQLDRLPDIAPAVRALGDRHIAYAVEPAHCVTVGAALLATLEAGRGDLFTTEMSAAWAAAYTVLADTMRRASAATPINA
jgi:hemoglobin-like flavoprotein